MFALMAFYTQLARLPARGAYKKPKVQKMDRINQDYQVYPWPVIANETEF